MNQASICLEFKGGISEVIKTFKVKPEEKKKLRAKREKRMELERELGKDNFWYYSIVLANRSY